MNKLKIVKGLGHCAI